MVSQLSSELAKKKEGVSRSHTTPLKDFLALIKVGIVNSNLITTFTGFWLALFYNQLAFQDYIVEAILTVFGSSFVIAGACAINNYIDRDIDHLMERTMKRPTVTGKIEPNGVIFIGLFFILAGLLMLSFATLEAALYAGIGAFVYIFLYTLWTKRQYTLNTVVGSISGAVPPLIGWAAVDGNLHIVAWALFFLMFIWQPPHFLSLAMRRCEEYRRAGIPMLPVVHGFGMTKRQIFIWIVCLFPLPFYLIGLGPIFVVISTLLNIGWLYLAIRGFKATDDMKWARNMFIYSLNYLTISFVLMILSTFIV